jgi:hypothetical protein
MTALTGHHNSTTEIANNLHKNAPLQAAADEYALTLRIDVVDTETAPVVIIELN